MPCDFYRVEPFDGSMYSGYEPQRTHPASFRGEPPSTTGAHYYIFAIDGTLTPEDPRLASSADSDDDGAKATLAAKVHGQKASKKVRAPESTSYSYAATQTVCVCVLLMWLCFSFDQAGQATAGRRIVGMQSVRHQIPGPEKVQRAHQLGQACAQSKSPEETLEVE